MEIVLDIATTDQQFEQILRLQRANLFTEVSEEEQQKQGFVFAEHSLSMLQMMASKMPQVIALSEGKVVGYTLAMIPSMRNMMPRLVPMFDEFERSEYKGKPLAEYRFMVGGQICVDKAFRGKGLLSKLYHETRKRVLPDYDLCVTEIAIRNSPSLIAHEKMGFEVINTYHDGKELWNIVLWDFHKR
jgi:hypothetical protein